MLSNADSDTLLLLPRQEVNPFLKVPLLTFNPPLDISLRGSLFCRHFASLFCGRTDIHGHLYDEADPDDPKYSTKTEPVTLEHYRDHLLGKRWLGIHPLVGDRCRFAATDLDKKDFEKALVIRDTLMEFGLKAYIAEAKHKGYRILAFFLEPQLARDVRLVLLVVHQ